MRLLLTLVAAGLFAISIGCAPEAAPKTAAASSDEVKTPAVAPAEGETAKVADTDKKSDAGEFQTVSLKLPGMT